MRILMAGVSGFLGTRLVDRLTADGHQITRLVRRPPRRPDERQWDPSAAQLDPTVVAAADAVVNLAGAGVGDKRWNEDYKRLIRSSRVDTTTTLAITIAGLAAADRPATMLNASAVGWYGNTGDRVVEEDSPAGEGFLADVCRVWEAATRPAEDAGVRVVRLRTGLPLHRDGGMLKPQLLPFRLGVGGKLGSGRQWLPWISLQDWLDAVAFLLARDDVAGPVNVVGPNPVTNADFARELARQLHRPAIMPVPALALKIALGGFAHEALTSARVLPAVLPRAGFTWTHPHLPAALHAALTE
ncbi:TIGR01777 family oxidoreductase [Micromonospora sp. DR5-3]|uniref:TIGR01777 family oxidoreductase n=1 Tax=unclassified Micromonospora TaxID=2617518 RepID=UPI0011D40A5B|nr:MULTISPECIES: TIGR01777 family oxidoreductase [unclassified Micromonospora]MCW3814233.1 TIGR01777 family oxidoreductase [Micromonospora sp. DR5-3]TYC25105.1 TIGR01777 family protein [Micromonospora sp. MP36]